MTLRFLGDIAPDQVPELVRCVAAETAPLPHFRMHLGAVRPFPNSRRPDVVVLEVGPEEALAEVFAAVERGVTAAGFAPEERAFRSHLTLGRLRGGEFPDVTGAVTPEGQAFDVTEIVLFRSELQRSGARHTALERMQLAG